MVDFRGNVDTVTVKVDAAASGDALIVDLKDWTFAAWTHDPAPSDGDRVAAMGDWLRAEQAAGRPFLPAGDRVFAAFAAETTPPNGASGSP